MTRRPLTAFRLAQLLAVLGIAALAACSSSDQKPVDDEGEEQTEDGSGGTRRNETGGGGSTAQGSKAGAGNSNRGGSAGKTSEGRGGSAGGATTAKGGSGGGAGRGTAGAAGAGKGGSSQGGGGKAGGGQAGGGEAGAGQAGTTEVECSNTDKSILPVDENGWVDKACNDCGIQGAFYWYAAKNIEPSMKCGGATCVVGTPPWSSTEKGMCITGKATGVSSNDDWGAGIGLSLADSGGEDSVKGSFNATSATCGNITGFDITLTGNTSGMPVRVGFATSDNLTEETKTISPFIPVAALAGSEKTLSGSTEIIIKNAAIPADWNSDDPSPPDPKKIYDLQVQIATDEAEAGDTFELCIKSVKPAVEGGGGGDTGAECKGTNAGKIQGNLDRKALGSNYGFQNNVNNLGSGSQSVTGYYGSTCAALTVDTSGIKCGNGSNAPASYPSIILGWHWGDWLGSYTKLSAKTISSLTSVISNWSFTPPSGPKWDVAYDMWVAQDTNAGSGGPGSNAVEVMVWLDYSTASTTNPIGTKQASFTSAGTTWDVWHGANGGGWYTVSYVRTPSTAPVSNFDLAPFLKDSVKYGKGSASWYLLSVQAGFELFDATSGGSINSYSCSIK